MSLSLSPAERAPPRARPRRRKRPTLRQRLRRWRKQWRWAWRQFGRAPRPLRIAAGATTALLLFAAANLAYHVVRKPAEMLFPISGALSKLPAETWEQYAPLFREYATATISPELLAALAQVEGAGNPLALTYWRWRLSWDPFAIYGPASTAVGMYQMTDGTFAEARRFCIRDHAVLEAGCRFNAFYTRLLPSDAVELAAVSLDRGVAAILAHRRGRAPSARQKDALAAVLHLCGGGPAAAFARHGFRFAPGERCGDHDPAVYLARVEAARREFQRLAAAEP